MKRAKNLLCLLLAGMLLSCGSTVVEDDTNPDNGDTNVSTDTSVETEADPYAGIDLGGMELRFLNTEGRMWDTMSILDFAETDGTSLNDAIYNRNRTLEEKLNMTIIVNEVVNTELQSRLNQAIAATEDL